MPVPDEKKYFPSSGFRIKDNPNERKQSAVCEPVVVDICKNKSATKITYSKQYGQRQAQLIKTRCSTVFLVQHSKSTVQNKCHGNKDQGGKDLIQPL